MPSPRFIRKEIPNATTLQSRGRASTRRPPGNIPYLVDNLWAWMRPADFPDRRHAAFASPEHVELQEVAGTPYLVHVSGTYSIAQIEQKDARYHPDSKNLPKLITKLLGREWMNSDMEQKISVGRLWIPCLSADEVELIFRESTLANHRGDVAAAITFWKDARLVSMDSSDLPYADGEIFFEADSWHLSAL